MNNPEFVEEFNSIQPEMDAIRAMESISKMESVSKKNE